MTAIKELDIKRFNALVAYTRSPLAAYISRIPNLTYSSRGDIHSSRRKNLPIFLETFPQGAEYLAIETGE